MFRPKHNYLAKLGNGLTIMVNDRIVSRVTGTPTRRNGGIIQRAPLYPADEVLDLLEQRGVEAFTLWTNDCQKDVQNLALDHDGVLELLRHALTGGRFLNAQWCQQKPGGPWAACDAYSTTRSEWIEAAFKSFDIQYYVKFAMSRSGKLLLLVSCHASS